MLRQANCANTFGSHSPATGTAKHVILAEIGTNITPVPHRPARGLVARLALGIKESTGKKARAPPSTGTFLACARATSPQTPQPPAQGNRLHGRRHKASVVAQH